MKRRNYTEHCCVLKGKHRTFFRYVWILSEDGHMFRVNVGKSLYEHFSVGDQLTIGKRGRTLVNVRPGFCEKVVISK